MELILTPPWRVGTPGGICSILAEQKQMGRRKWKKIISESKSSIQNQMSTAITARDTIGVSIEGKNLLEQ